MTTSIFRYTWILFVVGNAAVAQQAAGPGPEIEVTAERAEIRVTENGTTRVIRSVKRGEKFWALETKGDFYRVTDAESLKRGWIWRQHVRPVVYSPEVLKRSEKYKRWPDEIQRLYKAQKYAEMLPYLEERVKFYRENYSKQNPGQPFSLIDLAYIHFDLGNYKQSRTLLEQGNLLYLQIYGEVDRELAVRLKTHAICCRLMNDWKAAKESLLQILDSGFSDDYRLIIDARKELAVVYENLGEFTKVISLGEDNVLALRASPSPSDREIAELFHHIAMSGYFPLGRYEEAALHLEEALRIRRGLTDLPTAVRRNTLWDLGETYRRAGKFEQAVDRDREALDLTLASVGADHLETAEAQYRLALNMARVQKFDEAEALQRECLVTRRKTAPVAYPLVSSCLRELGLICRHTERFSEAKTLFQEAFEITATAKGNESLETALLLTDLGNTCQLLEDFDGAAERYEAALKIRRQALAADHLLIAESLMSLAGARLRLSSQQSAEALFREAIDVYARNDRQKSVETATCLEGLSFIIASRHDLSGAQDLLRQACDLYQSVLGPDHRRTQAAERKLGICYRQAGDPEAAAPVLERVLDWQKSAFGENSHEVHFTAAELARVYGLMDRSTDAGKLLRNAFHWVRSADEISFENRSTLLKAIAEAYLQVAQPEPALEICDELLTSSRKEKETKYHLYHNNVCFVGERYFDLAKCDDANTLLTGLLRETRERADCSGLMMGNTLRMLGRIEQRRANFSQAEAYLDEALVFFHGLPPELDDPHAHCNALYTSSLLHSELGDYVRAKGCLQQCLELLRREMSLTEQLNSLNSLGAICQLMGDYHESEIHLRRALSLVDESNAPDSGSVLFAALNLGRLCQIQRKFDESESLLLRAREGFQKSAFEDVRAAIRCDESLGLLYTATGRFDEAELSLRDCRLRYQQHLGDVHPFATRAAENLAELYAVRGVLGQAVDTQDEARRAIREYLVTTLPALSESAQQTYLAEKFRPGFAAALSLAFHEDADENTVHRTTDWLLNGKGVTQELLARAYRLANSEGNPLLDQLRAVNAQLSALTQDQQAEHSSPEAQNRLTKLTLEQKVLQKKLAAENQSGKPDDQWVTTDAVRNQLASGTLFVNIARFRFRDFGIPHRETGWKSEHYVAWIIPPVNEGKVRVVDLGDAEEIDHEIQRARSQIIGSSAALAQTGEEAATAAFQEQVRPLSERLLKPLGDLTSGYQELIISPDGELWTLPWSALILESGQFLVERLRTRFVFSGRELITSEADVGGRSTPAVFADAAYDQPPKEPTGLRTNSSVPPEDRSVDRFLRLPSTALEATAIAPSLKKYSDVDPRIFLQAEASESNFRTISRPSVMVLSTHGYFEPAPEGLDFTSGGVIFDNPLLRCGLALAGANQRVLSDQQDQDDGILTGLEIVGTDLSGTELVVLSACETGLGDVRHGEGVAGLRHAFRLAGAKSVVSSLWQVDDSATVGLIVSFFGKLASGTSKAEALRTAQLERIEKRRERYGAAHPFYWAAFTLTGN
ncbi:MAG: CHAT domain-containing tetratricopeptide repeat protein [Planctomycetaceae bacterium]